MAADSGVLLVLVATNGASWLRECIAGIKVQQHTPIDVVAVDNASTDSSRQVLEKAFGKENVVHLDRRAGYGRALTAGLKAAGERAGTAHAFLFLHDDAAMEPNTVTALLDALTYEGVGIAGAKLVEWDDAERLQSVGFAIDRFARPADPLERGELDQGQYDRVRETMWVSAACMAVRREVVEKAGFFDQRYVTFCEDLDFCWRARVAGYKVAATGATRVRHAAASLRAAREGWAAGRVRYFVERNILASLIKNYSRVRLIWTLPLAVALALLNVVVLFFGGHRREAGQVIDALRWNLAHMPSTIRARARVQRARTATDEDVMKPAAGGASRFRALAERLFERVAGDPALGVEEAEGLATPGERPKLSLRDRIRAHPAGSAAIVLVTLYLIASRTLFRSGGLAGADMPAFPSSSGDLFRSFFSGWRTAGVGDAAPASPATFLTGALSLVTFGSTWLAQRLLLAAMIPAAGFSASRLASRLGCGVSGRRVAAFVYALSPLALWAFGEGRIADMILVAAAPGLCVPLVRAAGLAPAAGWREIATPALGLAAAATLSPWTILFVAGTAVVLAAATAIAGAPGRWKPVLATGGLLCGGALLLLFPWSMELFRNGSAFGLGGPVQAMPAWDLARLLPGPREMIPGVVASVVPIAAAAAFVIVRRERDVASRMLVVVGTAGLLLAFAVARGVPWIGPRSSLPLVLYAIAVAMLIGFGAEGARPALAGRQFGTGQIGIAALTVGVIVATATGGWWLLRGSRPGWARAGEIVPAFLAADLRQDGEFRILWIDGSARRVRAALTGPAGDTMTTYAERRSGPGQDALDRTIAGIVSGTMDAGGRQLATFGVRYVFMRRGASQDLIDRFERQSDISFGQRFPGSLIYKNDAWLPVATGVASQDWSLASAAPARTAATALAGAELDPKRGKGFQRTATAAFAGSINAGAKRVLLASSFDPRWRLVVPEKERGARAVRSFGWATAFPAAAAGAAGIVWEGQGSYRWQLLTQLAIFLAVALVWSRRAARERGE